MRSRPAQPDLEAGEDVLHYSLATIHAELQDALAAGDLGAIWNAADRLGWLKSVLDCRVEKSPQVS